MTKQIEIPGAERKRIAPLERVCEALIAARAAKKVAAQDEKDVAEKAQDLLAKHGLDSYLYVDGEAQFLVTREQVERTKVSELHRKRKPAAEYED